MFSYLVSDSEKDEIVEVGNAEKTRDWGDVSETPTQKAKLLEETK